MNALDSRVRLVWLASAFASSVVVGVVAGLLSGYAIDTTVGFQVGATAFLVAAILAVAFTIYRYRAWGYEVQEDALFIQRGVLTHIRTVAPFVRVQHVDSRRGPLERALGLASVVVYTAGSRGADVKIPGLTPDKATALQNRLRELAIESEQEDAV